MTIKKSLSEIISLRKENLRLREENLRLFSNFINIRKKSMIIIYSVAVLTLLSVYGLLLYFAFSK